MKLLIILSLLLTGCAARISILYETEDAVRGSSNISRNLTAADVPPPAVQGEPTTLGSVLWSRKNSPNKVTESNLPVAK